MTTRMVHPVHGATHAYGASDIEFHKARGWSVEVPLVELPKVVDETPVEEAAPERKKLGRPFKAK